MVRLATVLALLASPALAAADGKPFFSLYNTDLIVLMAFVVFVGILVYFKVPDKVTGMLDSRADTIRSELDEARRLREEALQIYAKFEAQQESIEEETARIVERARTDAELTAEQVKAEIEASIARRLKSAEDQIASAEAAAIREVRERAISVATAAAGDVIAKQMDTAGHDALFKSAIKSVETRLN